MKERQFEETNILWPDYCVPDSCAAEVRMSESLLELSTGASSIPYLDSAHTESIVALLFSFAHRFVVDEKPGFNKTIFRATPCIFSKY
jgi:hypothetical protein